VSALQAILAPVSCLRARIADEFTLAAAYKRTKSERLRGLSRPFDCRAGRPKGFRPARDPVLERIISRQKPLFV